MRRWLAPLLVLCAPVAVAAEPATREAAAREVPLFRVAPARGHARAFVQLGAIDDEAGVAAGGEASYHSDRCDYLRAGGQLRVGMNDTVRVAAEQWASVCVPVITMEFGHHLEWDVRPSLLAPLGLRPGRNRRETLRFHWQPLRGRLPQVLAAVERGEAAKQGLPPPAERTPAQVARLPQGEVIIFDVDLHHTILWDASTTAPAAALDQVEAAPFRYVHDRFTLDIVAAGGVFADDGAMVHAWLVKLEDFGIGPIDVTGGIGIVTGSAGPFQAAVDGYRPREIEVTSPRAVVGLAVPGDRVTASIRASHDVDLVPDGYVTVDSRLAAALTIEGRATRLSLEGALAATEVHVPGTSRVATATTGGGALALAHRLTPRLTASARFELARSFYAADVLAFERAPRWGASGFVVLEAAVAR